MPLTGVRGRLRTRVYEKDEEKKYATEVMAVMYIYNDYTNLNIQLIDEYNLNLKIFYNPILKIDGIIDEIEIDKLFLLINKAGEIIINSKKEKEMLFNMEYIKHFIDLCVNVILADLDNLIG